MKKIWIIRHADPDFPGGVMLCLGRNTDIGISRDGARKALALQGSLEAAIRRAGRIFTSPLRRTSETAEILSAGEVSVIPEEGLIEMDTGAWDGLDFDTIRKRYPELYERRSTDFSIPPPGGETFADASARMRATLKALAASVPEDELIVVSHSGVIRAFLCDLYGVPYKDNRTIPLEYAAAVCVFCDNEQDLFLKTGR